MNKIYKIVWNIRLGIWVAVSEIAKGKVKASSNKIKNIKNTSKYKNFYISKLVFALTIIGCCNLVYAAGGV